MKIKNKSLSDKSRKWLKRHVEDEYVKKSSKDNYRSRAAYKLIEILQKYSAVKNSRVIMDLGSAPGSWCEVLIRNIHFEKYILAVDLLKMKPIKGVEFINCDFNDDQFIEFANLKKPFDLILSDISPNLSGYKNADHLRSREILENTLDIALKYLENGGHFVSKYFRTGDVSDILSTCNKNFERVSSFKPTSSRKESSEIYLICLNKKNIDS